MISVVIPNFNGKHFLKTCLDSLENQTINGIEIIIADNGSTDGSLEYISENYSEIKLIKLDKNYGFPKAVNEGIKASKYEYVMLLNNDTEVDSQCLEHLYSTIVKDDKIFSVASKMIQFNDRNLIDTAGDSFNALGWAYKTGYCKPIERYDVERVIFSACAGAALYRKSIFNEIGYFDEDFFAYLEDVDIGFRANMYGYISKYSPLAKVFHIISGTSGINKSEFKTKLSAKNTIYVLYKNMPFWMLFINSPMIFIGVLIKALYFQKFGLGKVYIDSSINAVRKCSIRVKKVKVDNQSFIRVAKIQILLCNNVIDFFIRRFI